MDLEWVNSLIVIKTKYNKNKLITFKKDIIDNLKYNNYEYYFKINTEFLGGNQYLVILKQSISQRNESVC